MTPDTYTNQEFYLDVGDGHQIYVHDWGAADATLPIVYVHGGPGASTKDRHKQRFDPNKQRVIFYDQRGAGKSLPNGSTDHNTTQDLVADMKQLRDHLGLKKYVITGGSWGVCLGFCYAIEHPEGIEAMVFSGIYTGTHRETEFIDKGIGFKLFYPDVWEAYVNRAPKAYANDPSKYHYQQAFGDDALAAKKSIYAYYELEGSLLSIDDRHTPQDFDSFEPEEMKIELHYLKNNCFISDKHIINHAAQLNMPIWLVQGRYDMVCPPITAYELNKQLPHSSLIWTTAGHGNDRPNYDVMRILLLQIAGK